MWLPITGWDLMIDNPCCPWAIQEEMIGSDFWIVENQSNNDLYSEEKKLTPDFRELTLLNINNSLSVNKGNHDVDGVCISDLLKMYV